MRSTTIKIDVLQILADNIKTSRSPKPVASETIAHKLAIKVEHLANVLKSMNESGTIISDIDNHYSIITPAGICLLKSHHRTKPSIGKLA